MDTAINDFKKRREERLVKRGIKPKYNPNWEWPLGITSFQRRRADRLKARGKETLKEEYEPYRFDEPDDETTNNNNNSTSSGGGGHGNTRLPFGLCKRFGIEIGEDWGPREAWDALAGKGITADGAYARLKEGKDPGIPEDGGDEGAKIEEESKGPKPSTNVLMGETPYKVTRAKIEDGKFVLMGTKPDLASDRELITFRTKKEMYDFLKKQGVESFVDPETGVEFNPKEMEIPKDTVSVGGMVFELVGGRTLGKAERDATGELKWAITGRMPGEPDYDVIKSFGTKKEMYDFLKSQGITEFADPETGEVVDPQDDEAVAELTKEAPAIKISGMDFGIIGVRPLNDDEHYGAYKYALRAQEEGGGPEQDVGYFASKEEIKDYLSALGMESYKDPDTGETVDLSDVPKTTILVDGGRYGDTSVYGKPTGEYRTWVGRGGDPWALGFTRLGKPLDSYRSRKVIGFRTKGDMLYYLKEAGIEKFKDPITGEEINPKEMDLPEYVMVSGLEKYTAVTVGLRDGAYTIIVTDMDGKKRTIAKRPSMARVRTYLESAGVDMDKVKMSPALKKREKERVAWLSSDKKEWVDYGGDKYGDLIVKKADTYPYEWVVEGESEAGEKKRVASASTKTELLGWLKDLGVEKTRVEKAGGSKSETDTIVPTDFHMPETVLQTPSKKYQALRYYIPDRDTIRILGQDMDGDWESIDRKKRDETIDDFKKRFLGEFGIDESKIELRDEDKESMEEAKTWEKELVRRRKEFEEKAIKFGDERYMEPFVFKDYDNTFCIKGYDAEGRERKITGWADDFDELTEYAKRYGVNDIDEFVKDNLRDEYEKYKKATAEFEEKAVSIVGEKYVEPEIEIEKDWSGDIGFRVTGYDKRGRKRKTGIYADSYDDLVKKLEILGFSGDSFPISDEARKKIEKGKRAKELVDTQGYHYVGQGDDVYKDIKIYRDEDASTPWTISGIDADGAEKGFLGEDSWEEAIQKVESLGIKDYKVVERTKDGGETKEVEVGQPVDGIHSVVLMRKPGGGFAVMAATRDKAYSSVYEARDEEEAKKWLRSQNVPDGAYKTRGMNPNDDVVRTHTEKSLEAFDEHRMKKAENDVVVSALSDKEKIEVAEMLTEMFDKGSYRMRRRDHFQQIVDGKFKNLLETGTSGGSTYKPGRVETGGRTFGMVDVPKEDHEKYGYWGLEDDAEEMGSDEATWYGGILFKFKKDRIKDRTTYTFGDSLDTRAPIAGYAGDKPTIEGLSALRRPSAAREILKLYRQYKRGEIDFKQLRSEIDQRCELGYVECHFHGNLDIQDVESVTFGESNLLATFSGMKPKKRKETLDKLRSSGVKLNYIDNATGQAKDGYEYIEERIKEWGDR